MTHVEIALTEVEASSEEEARRIAVVGAKGGLAWEETEVLPGAYGPGIVVDDVILVDE